MDFLHRVDGDGLEIRGRGDDELGSEVFPECGGDDQTPFGVDAVGIAA